MLVLGGRFFCFIYKYLAKFAETYSEREFGQQVVAQIPWGHNIVILDKVSNLEKQLPSIEDIQKRIQ